MIKNTKNLSFTFSPRALLSVGTTVVFYEIQEFLFSLGSLVYSNLVLALSSFTTLEKQENYINSEDFIYTELNCLTVLEYRTSKIHYLVIKEQLINYYTNILSLLKKNPLIIWVIFNLSSNSYKRFEGYRLNNSSKILCQSF